MENKTKKYESEIEIMTENIEVLCHSSIRINKENIIYIDPFKIDKEYKDADIIFITHDHYDHYSEEDINKVKKENTIYIVPNTLEEILIKNKIEKNNIIVVKPNENYIVKNIKIKTVAAYNQNKKFHPKENNWVGYIIEINNIKYYIAGDTDINEENKQVECDVALVPIGGTYTMDAKEAGKLINIIKPKIAIPTHYGSIVGEKEDEIKFKNAVNDNIKCELLIK